MDQTQLSPETNNESLFVTGTSELFFSKYMREAEDMCKLQLQKQQGNIFSETLLAQTMLRMETSVLKMKYF